jgi:hypothetical protein
MKAQTDINKPEIDGLSQEDKDSLHVECFEILESTIKSGSIITIETFKHDERLNEIINLLHEGPMALINRFLANKDSLEYQI